jgi:hypothetical protein
VCVPDRRTISEWSRLDDWSAEMGRMLRSIAPDVMGSLVTDLVMGASEGMPWLRDVLAGRVEKPNTARVRAILTALSMCSVPELARATIRETVPGLPGDGVGVQALGGGDASPTDMGHWKSQLSQRIGISEAE